MWWHNIKIDGYTATDEVHGIFIDRDGKWIVVPNKEYIKAHRPDMILPEISE